MGLVDLCLGQPLATEDEQAERIGVAKGIPIFGLDALSSAAYGPEAALTLLIPLGAAGVARIVPISASIIILLAIVYVLYRQTIMAYPQGGGSYTVANENLGVWPGLLAAAALMVDYVLTVAVGISAGVGALVSAVRALQVHTLAICLGILAVLTVINLRGVQETGGLFLVPTYLFIACLLATIAVGLAKTLAAGGHPLPVVPAPPVARATETVSAWLLLRAFASGCTAMTGVEAVSNGVMAFREPASATARRTLTIIIGILMVMLAGIAILLPAYGIAATPPGLPGYDSVLSQLIGAVAGKGAFYWTSIGSILVVLSLSANTAFADFPRLARAIAQNGFLPHGLALRGRRLVFEKGIYALALLAGVLLALFGGVMATAVTVAVVLVAKFTEGAWITLLLIPGLMLLMRSVKRHYEHVEHEIGVAGPIDATDLQPPAGPAADRALERSLGKSVALCVDDLARDPGPAYRMRRGDRSAPSEMGRDRGSAGEGRGTTRARPHRPPVAIPIRRQADRRVRPRPGDRPSLEKCGGTAAGARGEPLVLQPAPQQSLDILRALLLFKGHQRTTVINIPWYLSEPAASPRQS